MKHSCISILLTITFFSCKKDKETTSNCFSDIATTRKILNKEATVELFNNEFYIIEKGTIDTRLLPCSLGEEFKLNNLQVRITGEVKNTIPTGVCCTENFIINKIIR
jgi:hypothetical protein